MERELEAVRDVPGRLRVRQRRVRVHVRRRADAVPVGDDAAGRAQRLEAVEVARRAAGGLRRRVVVAAHHDGRLLAAREVPEPRQRQLVALHQRDQVEQQPLLLVGLRNRDLVRVDPVRLDVAGAGAVEEVVRADARDAVPLLARPGRVALARVDDRAREVVRERGRLAAARADRAERDGRVGRRGRRSRVERRDRRRAVEGVPVGRAVELDRAADDARARPVAVSPPAGRRWSASSRRPSARAGRPAACRGASRSGFRRRSPSPSAP